MAKLIPKQYAKVLYDLVKDAEEKELPQIFKSYIAYLQKEQVLSKAQYIIKEFESYSKEKEGITELTITTKSKLSAAIRKEIEKLFDGKLEVTEKTDEDLLGGVIVRSKNTILDASTNTQIKRLKRNLS